MTNPKRDRFSRLFPNRTKNLLKALEILENCSNKSNYDWDTEKVQEAWKLIAEGFADTADKYGIIFEVRVKVQSKKPDGMFERVWAEHTEALSQRSL